ncbi:hypothetical protein BH18ACT7_BH18ACT7_04690 [soil metagenome]
MKRVQPGVTLTAAAAALLGPPTGRAVAALQLRQRCVVGAGLPERDQQPAAGPYSVVRIRRSTEAGRVSDTAGVVVEVRFLRSTIGARIALYDGRQRATTACRTALGDPPACAGSPVRADVSDAADPVAATGRAQSLARRILELGDEIAMLDDLFEMLCEIAPLPASSGMAQRPRLHRGGDRQANCAPPLDEQESIRSG